jgi:hypothetical protein
VPRTRALDAVKRTVNERNKAFDAGSFHCIGVRGARAPTTLYAFCWDQETRLALADPIYFRYAFIGAAGEQMLKILIIALMLPVSLKSCAHQSVDLMPGTLSEKTRAMIGDRGVSGFYTRRGTIPQNMGLLLNQEPLNPHQSLPNTIISKASKPGT